MTQIEPNWGGSYYYLTINNLKYIDNPSYFKNKYFII